MTFIKNEVTNHIGRPIGSKNKASENIRAKISDFIHHNLESIQADYDSMPARDRLSFIEKLLKYSIPALQSVDILSHIKKEVENLPEDQLNELAEKILENSN